MQNRMNPSPSPAAPATAKPENVFVNLLFNVALPAILMAQLSKENLLGPAWGLVVALLFPLGYGLYDFVTRRKTNVLSILGFVGILASGVLGLLKLDGHWFAVKDAALPTVIGLLLLASMRSKEPLIKTLFFNETILDLPRVEAALAARGAHTALAALLRKCTVLVSLAFFLSAVLAYFLARWLLTSPGGTPEFNAQLSKMHWLSLPVISLPAMVMMLFALWQLIKGITRLTGLTTDEVLRNPPEKK